LGSAGLAAVPVLAFSLRKRVEELAQLIDWSRFDEAFG
jgi:hypothetical protein